LGSQGTGENPVTILLRQAGLLFCANLRCGQKKPLRFFSGFEAMGSFLDCISSRTGRHNIRRRLPALTISPWPSST
jgi:hypothetical protein